MKTNWKLIWGNLRTFGAGRSFECDYHWLRAEINKEQEAA